MTSLICAQWREGEGTHAKEKKHTETLYNQKLISVPTYLYIFRFQLVKLVAYTIDHYVIYIVLIIQCTS